MDAVGPHVHVVDLRELAVREGGVVGLPLRRQPGDRRRGKPGGGAEELLQGGHEVAGGQAMQVEQGQHLADLRRLAAPRWQDRGGEPLALARLFIDAPIVHPRRLHLDHAGRGGDLPGLVVAVTDHQAAPLDVTLICQLGYVGVGFGLQRGGQHPPCAFPNDLIQQRAAAWRGAVLVDYRKHGRVPSRPTLQRRPCSMTYRSIHREGTPLAPELIHRY